MRLKTLFGICSLICGCSQGPARPDTNVYQMIVTKDGREAYGFNMKTDYDANGELKPDAQAKIVVLDMWSDLRGWYCTDKQGFKNLKIYLALVRDYAKDHCK